MPTEPQELDLHVTLNDEASEGITKLREGLKQLTEGSGKEAMEKFKKEQEELGKTIKELAELATGGGNAMLSYIGKFGAAGAAMGGFAATIVVGLSNLKEFANKIIELTNKAKVIGMNPAELKSLIEQYERLGISADTVERSMAGFTDALAEVGKIGGAKRDEMIRAAGAWGDVMEAGIEKVEAQTTVANKLNEVLIQGQNVYDQRLKETNGDVVAATDLENKYFKMWEIDPQLAVLKGIENVSEEEKKRFALHQQLTSEYNKQVVDLGLAWEDWMDDIKDSMLAPDGAIVLGLTEAVKLVKELHALMMKPPPWLTELEKIADNILHMVPVVGAVLDQYDALKKWLGSGQQPSKSQAGEAPEKPPTATLDAEQLKAYGEKLRAQEQYQPARLLSAGMPAGGGRPLDDQMPGIGKGWEWMRRSSDIEDRRQVDDSLIQGDDYIQNIKSNTAETKRLNDNFRLLDQGKASIKGLGFIPGFTSGGEFGGGGATGGWTGAGAATGGGAAPSGSDVGAGAGEGAGDSHPSTGTGGGSGATGSAVDDGAVDNEHSNPASASTSIPSQFQADLTAMTLAGAKPHNIHAYMLQHGINLSEATCGQFMASVVKDHGGVPPKDPAIASNWNKFGGLQGAGYSSDPDAINIAVKQGTGIGSTGSHVTSAVPIKDASGKIIGYRGVGVNQGKYGVAGVGQYGRDVVSSIPLRIGDRPGEYHIRHEIIHPSADDAARQSIDAADGKQARTVKVDISGKLTANVNAPRGAGVKVEGGGAFNKTETNRLLSPRSIASTGR